MFHDEGRAGESKAGCGFAATSGRAPSAKRVQSPRKAASKECASTILQVRVKHFPPVVPWHAAYRLRRQGVANLVPVHNTRFAEVRCDRHAQGI